MYTVYTPAPLLLLPAAQHGSTAHALTPSRVSLSLSSLCFLRYVRMGIITRALLADDICAATYGLNDHNLSCCHCVIGSFTFTP
jgi:hypothetical protein